LLARLLAPRNCGLQRHEPAAGAAASVSISLQPFMLSGIFYFRAIARFRATAPEFLEKAGNDMPGTLPLVFSLGCPLATAVMGTASLAARSRRGRHRTEPGRAGLAAARRGAAGRA